MGSIINLKYATFVTLFEKPIKSADYLLRNLRSIEDDDLDSELSEETLVEQQSRLEFISILQAWKVLY